MRLYDYYRSSASYRVRIALNLKSLQVDHKEIHLINNGGEQRSPEYMEVNPQKLVPTLEENSRYLSQSLAIIEYLEERFPAPALLPDDPLQRAQARSLALIISSDIHPLNNLRVLQYLKNNLHANEEDIQTWYHHWIREGFSAFEKQLESVQENPCFCIGNQISIADICLIPQVYNAKRFKLNLESFPRIENINKYCTSLPAFIQAGPEKNRIN